MEGAGLSFVRVPVIHSLTQAGFCHFDPYTYFSNSYPLRRSTSYWIGTLGWLVEGTAAHANPGSGALYVNLSINTSVTVVDCPIGEIKGGGYIRGKKEKSEKDDDNCTGR